MVYKGSVAFSAVAGRGPRGYRDGVRNLEVMLESLSGGRRREIQEDGIVMEVNFFTLRTKLSGAVYCNRSCL